MSGTPASTKTYPAVLSEDELFVAPGASVAGYEFVGWKVNGVVYSSEELAREAIYSDLRCNFSDIVVQETYVQYGRAAADHALVDRGLGLMSVAPSGAVGADGASVAETASAASAVTSGTADATDVAISGAAAGAADVATEWASCGTCEWRIDDEGCLTIRPKEGESGTLGTWANESEAVPWSGQRASIKTVNVEGAVTATTCAYLFYGCSALENVDLVGLDTSTVTDMSYLFCDCSSLKSLSLSAAGIDTSHVADMSYLFCACCSLETLDISGINTSKVTSMNAMFHGCASLSSLDVRSFDTANVTTMAGMFRGCKGLPSLDVTNFDTSRVTSMQGMFELCSSLESIDLRSFDTSGVTNLDYLFSDCEALSKVVAGKSWSSVGAETGAYAFYDCESIVGGNGTTYDSACVVAEYARVDRGPSSTEPGYLTWFVEYLPGDVNFNSRVNIVDAQIVLSMSNGDWTSAGSTEPYDMLLRDLGDDHDAMTLVLAADMNADGIINALDPRVIQCQIHSQC